MNYSFITFTNSNTDTNWVVVGTLIISILSFFVSIKSLFVWKDEIREKRKYELNSKAYKFLTDLSDKLYEIKKKHNDYEETTCEIDLELSNNLDIFIELEYKNLQLIYNDLRRLNLENNAIKYIYKEFYCFIKLMNNVNYKQKIVINYNNEVKYYLNGNFYYKLFLDENSDEYINNIQNLIKDGLNDFDNRIVEFYLDKKHI